MDLLARVRRFVREHDLMRAGTGVVAAVSGGSDSVALAHLLHELHGRGALRLVGVAHFNHQLRPSAGRDERMAAEVARAIGLPFIVDREDVAARARAERRSLEDAARAARYAFFERARRELGAEVVALGHTRDDQAETFLLRLFRGAGPRGLAGMHPRRATVVRPLLDCRRADLRAFLEARGLTFVDDESNADVTIPRNRVRAELLPFIEQRFNPSIVDVLADAAALARDDWHWMVAEADALIAACDSDRRGEDASRRLDIAPLLAAPIALRRLALWRAMSEAAGSRPVAFAHVEAALGLLTTTDPSAGLDLPGHRLERVGGCVVLMSRDGSRGSRGSRGSVGSRGSRGSNPQNLENPANPQNPENPANPENQFWYPLSIPGEVLLREAACVVSADTGPRPDGAIGAGSASCAIVRSDLCPGPLAVRNRRPGDRFRPVGLDGRKKLQDFFVDRKIARRERDRVPLVVDERDRIVWVAGHGIDAQFRVTGPTQSVLILRVRRV